MSDALQPVEPRSQLGVAGDADPRTGDIPLSPQLDKAGKSHMPAILKIEQAVSLVQSLLQENDDRTRKNSRIARKYASEQPHDPSALRADGLSWKSNFSTKPLSTLIDRVVPRLTTAVRQMRYLTSSQLPDSVQGASKKTDAFRSGITRLIRGHADWEGVLNELAQEDLLFGYCGAGWLDTTSWMPRIFRQDSFLVPRGTKHHAGSANLVCFKEEYLVHDMFAWIEDLEIAKLAGVEVENVVDSINGAVPEPLRSTSVGYERIYADLQREGNVLTSFQGSKRVVVWHVLITEVDGHVTHVAFDDKTHKTLIWRTKQFASMSECAAFFSFQHGNGNIHGSKGIGREVYNLAVVLDRARCEVVDRMALSGKVILSCDEREIPRFRMSVVGNAILVGSQFIISQQRIDGDVEPYFALDKFLTAILDQVAGSTSPAAFNGDRVTKAEVDVVTSREEERSDAVIERFLIQFAGMISTMQRRICNPEAIDPAAKQFQVEMLKVMSREELDVLANAPAVSAVRDYTEMDRQKVLVAAERGKGNPLYDQRELEQRAMTALVNADFAEAVLLPENDPTEVAEQLRLQQLELVPLEQGQPVPVSPRDNHLIHLEALQQVSAQMIQAAVAQPEVAIQLNAIRQHAEQHVVYAIQSGQKEAVEPFKQWVQALGKSLLKLAQHEQQVEAMNTPVPGGAPPQQPAPTGQPPLNAPPRETISLNYKDVPPSVKRQMEKAAGFQPATESEEELARIHLLNNPQKQPGG